ncbi:MAG: alpha-galactosidase [Bryobacterales bacterium]|nr:alpha-galactosidase [Bryobacterales bacterium]
MSNRREFLKQAGSLAALPLSAAPSLAGAAPESELPSVAWHAPGERLAIRSGGEDLFLGLCPAIRRDGSWQSAEALAPASAWRPHTDLAGRGAAATLACKLGDLTAELLLVNYEGGQLGCRLSVTNPGSTPVTLGQLSPLMSHPRDGFIRLGGDPGEWRVYLDSGACGGKCASYALTENDGSNAGAVTVLWSPSAGRAVAVAQVEVERSLTEVVHEFGEKGFLTHQYRWTHSKTPRLRIQQDATGYRLDPSETFTLDQCLLVFDSDPFRALTRLADAMAAFNHVRKFTNSDAWIGWMTWYNQESHLRGGFGATGDTCASYEVTMEQSRFLVESGLANYGLRDIAIDDGYQKRVHLGDWLESVPTFPTGMEGLARDLSKLGMKPAVWITPFLATADSAVYRDHPDWFVRHGFDWYHAGPPVKAYEFDPTAPGAIDWLLGIFRTFSKWGYHAFKNDFSGGLISSHGKQYHNRKQTGLMRWRWTWRRIKEALGGDGACSLQLCGANNLGAIGIVDSVRTGSDIGSGVRDAQWKTIREDTATTAINRWWQNKRFFICDADNLQVAEYKNYRLYLDTVDYEYKMARSWDEARVRAALVVATGGNIILGDRLTLLEPERVDIIRTALPLYGESAISLDMFDETIPSLWWHHVVKPWGSWEVLSVVNFGEASMVKEVPLRRMKIPRGATLAAWEFWSRTRHEDVKDDILRVAVKPHSIKTFRLTPVRPDQPTLVGTSFHIVMGAMEVAEHARDAGALRLRITRPGSEKGVCAFWSPKQNGIVTLPVEAGPEGAILTIS